MKIRNRLHYDIGFGWGMDACKNNASRIPIADKRLYDFIYAECKKDPQYRITDICKGWGDGYEYQINCNVKTLGI